VKDLTFLVCCMLFSCMMNISNKTSLTALRKTFGATIISNEKNNYFQLTVQGKDVDVVHGVLKVDGVDFNFNTISKFDFIRKEVVRDPKLVLLKHFDYQKELSENFFRTDLNMIKEEHTGFRNQNILFWFYEHPKSYYTSDRIDKYLYCSALNDSYVITISSKTLHSGEFIKRKNQLIDIAKSLMTSNKPISLSN
jgi:hypothetical protein